MPVLSSDEFIQLENERMNEGRYSITSDINESLARSFNHEPTSSVEISLQNKEYIGFIELDNQIIASGLGGIDSQAENGTQTIYIHSFSVNSSHRGRGLCQEIVSEFIQKFSTYIIYLTVRTQSDNINESAIKCYEKQGFIMLPQVYRDHYDGQNTAMIRVPIHKAKKTNKKNKKRRKTRKTR